MQYHFGSLFASTRRACRRSSLRKSTAFVFGLIALAGLGAPLAFAQNQQESPGTYFVAASLEKTAKKQWVLDIGGHNLRGKSKSGSVERWLQDSNKPNEYEQWAVSSSSALNTYKIALKSDPNLQLGVSQKEAEGYKAGGKPAYVRFGKSPDGNPLNTDWTFQGSKSGLRIVNPKYNLAIDFWSSDTGHAPLVRLTNVSNTAEQNSWTLIKYAPPSSK